MTFSPECIYNEAPPSFLQMTYIEELKCPDLTEEKRKMLTIERTKLSLYHPENYSKYFNKKIYKRMSSKRMDFFARELHSFDVTRKLPFIEIPTKVLGGRHDGQSPFSYSVELAEAIPNAQLTEFANSNHYPYLEESKKFREVIGSGFD